MYPLSARYYLKLLTLGSYSRVQDVQQMWIAVQAGRSVVASVTSLTCWKGLADENGFNVPYKRLIAYTWVACDNLVMASTRCLEKLYAK